MNTADFEVLITEEMIDRFAELSGDRNKIHTSHEHAKSLGMPARVAYGMLLAGLVSRLVGEHLPGGDVFILSFKMDFHKPTHPGDQIKVSGVLGEESGSTRTMEVKFRITRGETLLSRGSVLVQRR